MIYTKNWVEYYEDIFELEPGQIEFFEKLAGKTNSHARFLDVEAGPGTVALKLAERHDMTVTDSIPEFVQMINAKQTVMENKIHTFNLNPFDIPRYLGKNFYNVIFCLHYRLIFLKNRVLVKKLIFDTKNMLPEGGYLVFDLINFAKLDFSEEEIILPVKKSSHGSLSSIMTRDEEAGSYIISQTLTTSSGKIIDVVKDEVVTPFSLQSFNAVANELKFSSVEYYNDYMFTPFTENSDRIICVLKK